ncbi:uncharacterized protein ACBT44_016174 isoform 1-T1 [Syngnathus typhle]
MPEPAHLAPLNVEEKRLYSESLLDDPASQPISKEEPGHPAEETHFGVRGPGTAQKGDVGPPSRGLTTCGRGQRGRCKVSWAAAKDWDLGGPIPGCRSWVVVHGNSAGENGREITVCRQPAPLRPVAHPARQAQQESLDLGATCRCWPCRE